MEIWFLDGYSAVDPEEIVLSSLLVPFVDRPQDIRVPVTRDQWILCFAPPAEGDGLETLTSRLQISDLLGVETVFEATLAALARRIAATRAREPNSFSRADFAKLMASDLSADIYDRLLRSICQQRLIPVLKYQFRSFARPSAVNGDGEMILTACGETFRHGRLVQDMIPPHISPGTLQHYHTSSGSSYHFLSDNRIVEIHSDKTVMWIIDEAFSRTRRFDQSFSAAEDFSSYIAFNGKDYSLYNIDGTEVLHSSRLGWDTTLSPRGTYVVNYGGGKQITITTRSGEVLYVSPRNESTEQKRWSAYDIDWAADESRCLIDFKEVVDLRTGSRYTRSFGVINNFTSEEEFQEAYNKVKAGKDEYRIPSYERFISNIMVDIHLLKKGIVGLARRYETLESPYCYLAGGLYGEPCQYLLNFSSVLQSLETMKRTIDGQIVISGPALRTDEPHRDLYLNYVYEMATDLLARQELTWDLLESALYHEFTDLSKNSPPTTEPRL